MGGGDGSCPKVGEGSPETVPDLVCFFGPRGPMGDSCKDHCFLTFKRSSGFYICMVYSGECTQKNLYKLFHIYFTLTIFVSFTYL